MKTWWQVYYWDAPADKIKCFGFASVNEFVSDHPDYVYKQMTLKEYKKYLLRLPYLQVIRIC